MSETKQTNPYAEIWKKHPMRKPRIGAVILNVSIGQSGDPLERVKTILRDLTGHEPTETRAKKTWRDFGIRKNQPVGAKVTIRGQEAIDLLKRLLDAKDFEIPYKSFDENGNLSFGIREHIDIPGMKYDPYLGIIGMDVIVQMERPGFRLRSRRIGRKRIPKRHKLTRDESAAFFREEFNLKII